MKSGSSSVEKRGDPRQLALEVRLRPGASFANFVPGDNADTLGQMSHFAQSVGDKSSGWVACLAGPASAGKSHLLEAACRQASDAGRSCAYLSLRERQDYAPDLLDAWEACDLVCIDDVDEVPGDEIWEQALFGLYNRVDQAGGRLILAGRNTPRGMNMSLADLQSRLSAALVLPLRTLDEAGRLAALKLRARERGLEVNDEVGGYILRRIRQDMTSLMNVLEQLDGAAMAAQRRLTVPFVRELV